MMPLSENFSDMCGGRGRSLLKSHLNGNVAATRELASILDATCDGLLDEDLRADTTSDDVHVTTIVHLMTLAVMNRYDGMQSSEFYKGDSMRYVRLNLMVQRLLGIQRLTVGIPNYAFGAESLGQAMMYPDAQAPGSDPGRPLVSIERWQDMPHYDPSHEVTRIVKETAVLAGELAGTEPVVHLVAPYSLAAEIFGQEHLINALNNQPDTVRDLLAHLTEVVLAPWCEDLASSVANVWIELSDASGSPMFIGPHNFLLFAVEPVRRLIEQPGWGERVFVANYRGDSTPRLATRSRRRQAAPTQTGLSFDELLAAKIACCPHFITRLESDAAPEEKYAEAAINYRIPLYLGIGAVRLDQNSVGDIEEARAELHHAAFERASLIRSVRSAIYDDTIPSGPWAGDLYVEDTNSETDLSLLTAVLEGCAAANTVEAMT